MLHNETNFSKRTFLKLISIIIILFTYFMNDKLSVNHYLTYVNVNMQKFTFFRIRNKTAISIISVLIKSIKIY